MAVRGPVPLAAWSTASLDWVSKRFHNLLLKDDSLATRLRVLDQMFAVPPPPSRGVYRHHDGYRS
jgi:hypothetical protein